MNVQLDPAQLRDSLDREAVGRCQLAAATIATWAALSLVIDRAFAPAIYGLLAALDLGLIALCGLCLVALRRGVIPPRHASLAGFVLTAALLVVMWIAFDGSGQALYPMCAMLVVIGAAFIHLYGRWVAASAAVALGGWAVTTPGDPGFATYGIAFAGTALIAGLVHFIAYRYLVRIEGYRQKEADSRRRLENALAAANRELDERVRAEAEREALRAQLTHSQRLEALGTLAGGIAHDMNNVLGAIIGLAEFVADNPADAADDLAHLMAAAQRGADLTRNLLAFSRRGQYRKEKVDPGDVIKGALGLLSRTLPRAVAIETELGHGDARIEGDPSLLGQAVVNLCINASDAMDGKGTLALRTSVVELGLERAMELGAEPGRHLAIAVTDTGAGMDRETQRRIFEPFFTTKPQGKGTGLGLAMVYGTVQAHAGAIALASEPGVGSTFTLYLPVVDADAVAATDPRPDDPLIGRGLVLVVDDDADVREVIVRKLTAAGFQVVTAADGAQAVAAFKANRGAIRLVVLDMSMPVMGGADCFRALRAIDPTVRVLLVSGYTAEEDARACLAGGALGLLAKPFTSAQLACAVRQAIRGEKIDAAALVAVA
jgi:signal transduction histidine kinase/CheY-like chemotaxis protein